MKEAMVPKDLEQHGNESEDVKKSFELQAPTQPVDVGSVQVVPLAESAPVQTAAPAASAAPRLEALDAPRWLASAMIVASHFFIFEPCDLGSFAKWGGMWTQFFFCLSGFVLAYVEMARSPKKIVNMTMLEYIKKRLLTVYPTYLLTVILSLFQYKHHFGAWLTLPLNVLLMHEWIPICWYNEESTWPGKGVMCIINQWAKTSWFMSVLVIYWMIVRPLAARMRHKSLGECTIIILGCWMFSGVIGLVAMLMSEDGSRPMSDALLTAAFQFGPWGYFHVFICGITTARLFILTSMKDAKTGGPPNASTERLALDKERAPFFCCYGCVLGYLLYALLVVFIPGIKDGLKGGKDKFYAAYWIMHNGGMLPVMLLILVGGAAGVDPLARYVFQTEPFLLLGRLSYAQYLLQFNVFDMVFNNVEAKGIWRHLIFCFALPGFAYLVERFFTRTFTEYQRTSQGQRT